MNRISWAPSFKRAYKKFVLKHPLSQRKFFDTIKLLEKDIWLPILRTHKLHGKLENLYSCSIDYETRLLFEVIDINDDYYSILLVDVGSHEEVY